MCVCSGAQPQNCVGFFVRSVQELFVPFGPVPVPVSFRSVAEYSEYPYYSTRLRLPPQDGTAAQHRHESAVVPWEHSAPPAQGRRARVRHTHTHAHARTNTRTRTHAHTTHTRTHARTVTHTHAQARTHTHMHTHAHAQARARTRGMLAAVAVGRNYSAIISWPWKLIVGVVANPAVPPESRRRCG
jgi:hypothetical protein